MKKNKSLHLFHNPKVNEIVHSTRNVLIKTAKIGCVSMFIGTTGFLIYDSLLESKFSNVPYQIEYTEEIVNHYNGQTIPIFILNDSQGLNLNLAFYKNSYAEYIKEYMEQEEAKVTLFDTSSLLFNKANHIDKFLEKNLSLQEIHFLEQEASKEAIAKVLKDNHLEVFSGLSNLATLTNPNYDPNNADLRISEALKESTKPTVIYSSSVNDWMWNIKNNPASYSKLDSNSDKRIYTDKKINDSTSVQNILDKIEKNFIHILSLNPNARIYVLSIYTPASLTEYPLLIELINEYNSSLEELCKKYNICFINTEKIGSVYSHSIDFHIDVIGHKKMASLLNDTIYFDLQRSNEVQKFPEINIETKNLMQLRNDLLNDISTVHVDKKMNGVNKDCLYWVYKTRIAELQVQSEVAEKAYQKYIQYK